MNNIDFNDFDGLEIHPCRTESEKNSFKYIEQCEPKDAEFWSVYGHCRKGGVECLEDFPSEDEARSFAHELLETWRHLNVFGLLG